MEQVLAHLKEFYMAYVLSFLCLAPLIYATRRYSLPVIFYTIETLIYLLIMHVVMWVLVAVARWFKEQSSMRALQQDGRPEGAPEWGTPFFEFWNRELYNPGWLVWLEVVLAALIFIAVLKYRPLRFQRNRGWQFNDKTQKKGAPRPPGPSYGARMGKGPGRR